MQSMGLKPWNDDDAAEGKAIIAAFASNQKEDDDEYEGVSPVNKASSSANDINKMSRDASASAQDGKSGSSKR
jgi:hypothetical protein